VLLQRLSNAVEVARTIRDSARRASMLGVLAAALARIDQLSMAAEHLTEAAATAQADVGQRRWRASQLPGFGAIPDDAVLRIRLLADDRQRAYAVLDLTDKLAQIRSPYTLQMLYDLRSVARGIADSRLGVEAHQAVMD